MAQPNKYFWDVQSASREVKLICGSFAPAGTGTITDPKGDGWSATRTGVGTFTITFDSNYNEMISANATLQLASAADSKVQIGSYDSAASTLVIRTITGTAAADIAANANNRVNFMVAMKRSTETPTSTATVS